MGVMMQEKFEQFEWLAKGITAKSPDFCIEVSASDGVQVDAFDRLGAIAKMENVFSKLVTSVIIYNGKAKGDFDQLQGHLAEIMIKEAKKDKKQEPEHISVAKLADKIAWMVIQFTLNPELEGNFTAKGRLYFAGIGTVQMGSEVYRKTWKQYENLMTIALELAIKQASEDIEMYRKNTYKDARI